VHYGDGVGWYLLKAQIKGRFREAGLEAFIDGPINPPTPFIENEVFINTLKTEYRENVENIR
jgi:hypothetical protein